jgi:hypothetical protein
MAEPVLVVRVAANLSEFKQNFAEGVVGTIDTTKGALASMSTAFDGSKIIVQANAAQAAIQQIGGVTHLTADEQARANKILEDGLEKYRLLGKEAPADMQKLYVATKQLSDEQAGRFVVSANDAKEALGGAKMATTGLSQAYDAVGPVLRAAGVDISNQVSLLSNLKNALSQNVTGLGSLGVAGAVVGAAFAGWKIGEQIDKWTGLSQKIADGTAVLMGWGDVAEQTAQAKADVLAKATRISGRAILDEAEAMRINAEAAQTDIKASKDLADAKHKERDAMIEILSYGAGWRDILTTIDEKTAQAVKRGIEAGANQQALAIYYKLTAAQVQAVAASLDAAKQASTDYDSIVMTQYKHQSEALQILATANLKAYSFDGQIAALDQLMAAERARAKAAFEAVSSEIDRAKILEDFTKRSIEIENQKKEIQLGHVALVNAAIAAELDAQGKLNAQYGLTVTGVIAVDDAYTRLTKALDELHSRRVAGISQEKEEKALIEEFTKDLYEEANAMTIVGHGADDIQKGFGHAAKGAEEFRGEMVLVSDNLDDLNKKLKAFYDSLTGGAGVGIPAGTAAGSIGIPSGGLGLPRMAGARAGGGPVDPGRDYLVGEKGPEILRMGSSGGSISPNAAGGGDLHLTVNVTQPLGTPQAVADAVGKAIIEKLRSQGVRIPGAGR